MIKTLLIHVQPLILILANNAFVYKELKGMLLIIARLRHPLEQIPALKPKLMPRLGVIDPQGIVLIKDLYDVENSPPGKKGANEYDTAEGYNHKDPK